MSGERALIAGGIIALQHTREYVGEDLLPAIEGWSWYDWTKRAEAYLAQTESTLDVLERLREVNGQRVLRWHEGRFSNSDFVGDGKDWNAADWSNATMGELGEMIEALGRVIQMANTVKKIRRQQTVGAGMLDPGLEDLREQLGNELADMIIYADLLAAFCEIDLAAAIVRKFNAVSDREGYPEKL